MRTTCLGMLVVILGLAGAGCSQTVYGALQARQRNQCFELDEAQRGPCLAAADTSYSDYDRTRTAAR